MRRSTNILRFAEKPILIFHLISGADFLNCIKTRKRPVCDIEIGHRSTNMSLLGMLSLKIGRSIKWDGEKEIIIGDPEANKLLRRKYRKPWAYPEV